MSWDIWYMYLTKMRKSEISWTSINLNRFYKTRSYELKYHHTSRPDLIEALVRKISIPHLLLFTSTIWSWSELAAIWVATTNRPVWDPCGSKTLLVSLVPHFWMHGGSPHVRLYWSTFKATFPDDSNLTLKALVSFSMRINGGFEQKYWKTLSSGLIVWLSSRHHRMAFLQYSCYRTCNRTW